MGHFYKQFDLQFTLADPTWPLTPAMYYFRVRGASYQIDNHKAFLINLTPGWPRLTPAWPLTPAMHYPLVRGSSYTNLVDFWMTFDLWSGRLENVLSKKNNSSSSSSSNSISIISKSAQTVILYKRRCWIDTWKSWRVHQITTKNMAQDFFPILFLNQKSIGAFMVMKIANCFHK